MTEPGGGYAPTSYQQARYDRVYRDAGGGYGLPDRKIAGERKLCGERILSLGCGTGNDLWYLSGDNTVVGLDYAAGGLEAGAGHGLQGVRGDLNLNTRLPFADRSFDIVVCKDVLEHLMEPLAVLREVRRVLDDHGYVVVSVPNHFYLPLRLRILFGQGMRWKTIGSDHRQAYEDWNYMHIRFFTFSGFKHLLAAAELRPEKWFWDLGTLAHYHNPDMWLELQLWKQARGLPLSKRAQWGVNYLQPAWRAFNSLVPRSLRSALVSVAPGLLCAGFYVRVRKA
jgi:SAM-dependent methyltransferase